MTLSEIKEQVMFQTNNDAEDVGDYLPALTDYINEAYDRLVNVWAKQHVPSTDYPALEEEPVPDDSDTQTEETETETEEWTLDVPKVPEWMHRHLADWATWLVYRNGNPQKQQRGMAFRAAFEEVLAKMSDEGGAAGLNEDGTRKDYKQFRNIPR